MRFSVDGSRLPTLAWLRHWRPFQTSLRHRGTPSVLPLRDAVVLNRVTDWDKAAAADKGVLNTAFDKILTALYMSGTWDKAITLRQNIGASRFLLAWDKHQIKQTLKLLPMALQVGRIRLDNLQQADQQNRLLRYILGLSQSVILPQALSPVYVPPRTPSS